MNPVLYSYLIAIAGLLPFAAFFFCHLKLKFLQQKDGLLFTVLHRVLLGLGIGFFFATIFCVSSVMTAKNDGVKDFVQGVGNLNLIGVPFGENRFGNFMAWLIQPLFLSGTALAFFTSLCPTRKGHFINRFVALPNLAFTFILLFLLEYGYLGEVTIGYKNAFLALTTGLALGASLFNAYLHRDEIHFPVKEIIPCFAIYLFVFIAFLPTHTLSTLLPTDISIFNASQTSWRMTDFSFPHRLMIYLIILYFVSLYFVIREDEEPMRRAVLLMVSLGALASFFTDYGFEEIFKQTAEGWGVNVSNLPLHLCHTALFVVPLCILFKWKRLFYFTYFINVFGAIMAMIWPNVGDNCNIFSPSIMLFWYNHAAALMMPLIAVSLHIFERPKMKQMGFSLAAFAVYFFGIVFANAALSPLVEGYDVNVPGSGTDYLFINGTYILDILSDEAVHMLDIKWTFGEGSKASVVYPLYQGLFFLSYTLIAFLMWFVYVLFFRIEDAHIELHQRYMAVRSQHIQWKERRKMEQLNNEELNVQEAYLQFIDFSKRYSKSTKLSANNVNLTIKGGEIFGFLGPNGAGKSTCIKTAIGIQPVTEGEIKVCGFSVSEEPVKAKRCIGYVPDHYALYEKLTGREYINYIADLYGVSKEDRDHRIGYYVDLFELNASFDAKMETYSHGMKQKIAIIAALIHDPKVWILDEPLTGLDPQSIFQVKKTMLDHAKRGNVVFFSSHIIDVVERLCTRIAVIRKGSIVYTGTMAETLKNHPEGLEKFYLSLIEEDEDEEEA